MHLGFPRAQLNERSTFLSRRAMVAYLAEIAWETDVWIAEDSNHLIHFNGEYLLQSY